MSNLLVSAINGEWDVVKSLVDVVDDINSVDDEEGRTALMYAVIDEENDAVKLLLDKGANVNLQDDFGNTALHFASQNHLLDIARLLLNYKADANIQDNNGNTSLSNAVFYSGGRGEMIQLLLEFGGDKYLENNYGVSPIKLAETFANYDISKYF
ncbi:ankyrin repeat domain-containing protein [Litchfieldia salsa]|uniref:Ankyrin repeat-containing protein n=1 Tax=Litchfieldia salsa TaxID=930152 RepID=A0A1H0SNZ5_9BACI|nr:ankyrin repeat domain-containing protein [Litchfieldia salsa]SDP43484.1 Ankyrin repeat-containing protein [Litchfieldia salsa]